MDTKIIVNELINYNNINNDSWNQTFNKVINKYGSFTMEETNNILRDTVNMLTRLGYDINDYPFSLTKYK